MQILKLYAWETSFLDTVTDIRHREIRTLRHMAYVQSTTSFLWMCVPFLVSLVTFATYVLVDEAHILDSKKAFVSLSLFNLMRCPLNRLPNIITGLAQANVSIKRINSFMNLEEVKSEIRRLDKEQDKDAVEVVAGTFKWEGKKKVLPLLPDKEGPKVVDMCGSNCNDFKAEANKVPDDVNDKKALITNGCSKKRGNKCATLKDISIKVPPGRLVAVVGMVGSGKSSLLSALLGEMERVSGHAATRGTISYVPQQAWIQNATLRDNVLFGKPFDQDRYNSAIMNSALEEDINMLPARDMTEIGEKGLNLSGGQKQRISLARAIYSNADIYLLDDTLSAVDAHVGKTLFKRAIGPRGCLAGTTRLLVTHGLTYLPLVDEIIVMREGAVSEVGSYSELLEKKGAFAEILRQYITEYQEEAEMEDDLGELIDMVKKCLCKGHMQRKKKCCKSMPQSEHKSKFDNDHSLGGSQASDDEGSVTTTTSLTVDFESSQSPTPERRKSTEMEKLLEKSPSAAKTEEMKIPSGRQQYKEEKVKTGSIGLQLFGYYVKNMGFLASSLCCLFFVMYQLSSAYSRVWLSEWSDSHTNNRENRDYYLSIYGVLGLAQALCAICGTMLLYMATLRGAERLHLNTLHAVLRAPMSFFDITPQGRILNRFSKDVDVLDTTMPMILRSWITCLLNVLTTFFIICYNLPIFVIPLAFILPCYFFVQRVYVACSRQLKRMESVSRSPIYSQFSETLGGIDTIRAFSAQDKAVREMEEKVDLSLRLYWPGIISNRWLAVRLEMVSNLIIFCSALFAVMAKDITPGLVGLSVSFAMSVTETLNFLVRMTSEVETNVVAVERLKEYAETLPEAPLKNSSSDSGADWPSKGVVEFSNYGTRYRWVLICSAKKYLVCLKQLKNKSGSWSPFDAFYKKNFFITGLYIFHTRCLKQTYLQWENYCMQSQNKATFTLLAS